MPKIALSNVAIEKIKVKTTTLYWDKVIPGFVLRVTPGGARTLLFIYRHPETRRQVKVRLGSWTIPAFKECRARASRMRYYVDEGHDPVLFEQAEREADRLAFQDLVKGTGPLTELFDRFISLFKRHVKPVLGQARVKDVTRANVADLHRKMSGRPVRGNRTLTMLHTMFEFAIEQGMRPEGDNPARRVRKYPETPRSLFLDDAEIASILGALDDITGGQAVADCLRLQLFTGCRGCEIRELRWEQVDLERRIIRLPRTKTGKPRDVPLNAMAWTVLSEMTSTNRSGFVFPAPRRPGRPLPYNTIHEAWKRMRAVTGLRDARPHDLRHAFATRAVDAGLSLPAAMLTTGHASVAAFMRYFEPHARAARAAADVVEQAYGKVVDLAAARRRRSA